MAAAALATPLATMRAVTFVQRLEFEVGGDAAMALGDVDGDGRCELAVGCSNGDLAVFKGDRRWHTAQGLGMITALCVGDVLNRGRDALVVVSGDGWCNIFFAERPGAPPRLEHVQRIPANTKTAILADVDGDGRLELVLGLTDRVVRSYRWVEGGGQLLGLNKWECANQIGAVSSHHSGDAGLPCLLVAQPGGTFMKIRHGAEVEYHPLSLSHLCNPNVSTEIVGDVEPPRTSHSLARRYAVATLDGTLMLVQDENILWSIQVDHQLFALNKLPLTGSGDNIVACSWDGQTYILDQDKNSVRFQLDESVRGFCSGFYSVSPDSPPAPCLVYTTFTNKVHSRSLSSHIPTRLSCSPVTFPFYRLSIISPLNTLMFFCK